jgi:hypothetical protein
MRLGFRKANNGSRRGKKRKAKTASTPKSVANNSGTGAFWPPAWPDDDASGRGGSGPGNRGGWGGAERSGRGEALAGRGAAAGEGLAGEGEIVSAEPSYPKPPATVRGVECETGACGLFFTRAWRGRAGGGVRSGVPISLLSSGTTAEIAGSASTLCAASGAAVARASAAAVRASVRA